MFSLKKPGAMMYIPDQANVDEALKRTTRMAISAHQDDIEIMAYHGILNCFGREDEWFFGVVVTDGAGSPRDDLYKDYTDEDMKKIRQKEQMKSAFVGEYSGVAMLHYRSSEVKDPNNQEAVQELADIIRLAQPEILYTHNLADKHDTHIGTVTKVIKALRTLPKEIRPKKVYGCEVWRSLDWLDDQKKVMMDVSGHPNIGAAVLEVHDSQICGGKRYDLATQGRRLANATYAEDHGADKIPALSYAMDLTPLIVDDSLDMVDFVLGHIEDFKENVRARIRKVL
ncbi:MAG: PIG-L family deacetylase [Clostridia bacterium]|nr:PIG-L family deacetylase [Clostridia bacterium]